MIEALRQLAHVSRKIVAIVDHDLLPFCEDKWKGLGKELVSLETFMKNKQKVEENVMKKDTFLEFVEKQVIMDVLFEPFVYKNFVQYDSFPYDPTGYLGNETAILNVFTFWNHYQAKYLKQLSSLGVLQEEFDKHE